MKTWIAPIAAFAMCETKRRYPSKKMATLAFEGVRRARRNRKKTLRVYCCPICKGWHLTSQ